MARGAPLRSQFRRLAGRLIKTEAHDVNPASAPRYTKADPPLAHDYTGSLIWINFTDAASLKMRQLDMMEC